VLGDSLEAVEMENSCLVGLLFIRVGNIPVPSNRGLDWMVSFLAALHFPGLYEASAR
jgi:hypothetical protein